MELRVRAMRIGLRLRKFVSAGAADTTTGAVVIATGSGAGIGPLSAFYKKSNELIEKKNPELQNASAKKLEKITKYSDTSSPLNLIFLNFLDNNLISYNVKCEHGV